MTRIGIVGAGVSGLHLGLWLRHYGIDATIQALADFYAFGFNHPDRYWDVVSNEARTEAMLRDVTAAAGA